MKLKPPPRRCTPEQFYVDYIPSLWRELAGDLSWPPWRYSLQFEITGDEAAVFALEIDTGIATGRTGTAVKPIATISSTLSAWELVARDLTPRIIRHTNKRIDEVRQDLYQFADAGAAKLDPNAVADKPGTVTIDFTDDAGDRGQYVIRIGDGSGPAARIEAKDADLWALLECRGRFTALLKSRVQLDGAVAYLFELARLFEGE